MPGLEMFGPYALEKKVIVEMVKSGRPGNFALGYTTENYYFIPKYIGRSDECLQQMMLNQVNHHSFRR